MEPTRQREPVAAVLPRPAENAHHSRGRTARRVRGLVFSPVCVPPPGQTLEHRLLQARRRVLHEHDGGQAEPLDREAVDLPRPRDANRLAGLAQHGASVPVVG